MATLTFDVSALDRASSTFDRIGDKVDRLATRLRALDSIRANPTVKVDIDDRGLATVERRLRGLPRRVQAAVTVSLRGAAGVLSQLAAIAAAVDRLDGRTVVIDIDLRGLGGALAQLATLRALLAAMGTLGGGGGSPGGGGLLTGLSGAAGVAVSLGLALVKAAAAATLLAVAGAGVTAAWGAASTAIALAPSALALLAAPLAAISLGSDAISESFKGIGEQLQADVGRTWAAELEPIVTRLARNVVPELSTGLQGTVVALTDVGEHLTGIAERAAAAGQLATVFDNVNGSIRGVRPGLEGIVAGLLDIAAMPNAFAPLTAGVNEFGVSFRSHVVDLIQSGDLDSALLGLRDMLVELGQGFSDLVHNGIEVFAGAAPGVNSFLNDLTGFFNRFDWDALGVSVGGVFRGLGESLAGVDQATIDNIEASFQRLSDAFSDPAVQQGIRDLIASIPTLIDWLRELVVFAGGAATGFAGFVNVIEGAKKVLSGDWGGFAQIAEGLHQIEVGSARAFPITVSVEGHDAQEQLARISSLIATLPVGAKTITVKALAPDAIATLESIGVIVERLPDEKGIRLTVPNDEVGAALSKYMSMNPPPIIVPLEPDGSAVEQWVPPAVAPVPVPVEPEIPPDFPGLLPQPSAYRVPVVPDTTQAIPILNAFRVEAERPTTSVHTVTHNVPAVVTAIGTLNQQRTTAPHVQTHNVPQVVTAISGLNRQNTTSTHSVSHNVPTVISAINRLNGHDTKSSHTITTTYRTVRASGGAVVQASGGAVVRRFAGGGILPGYAPGRDTIPAMLSPGESVLTPEATRLLGGRAIMALNRMTSGRQGTVVGQGTMPGAGRASGRGFVGSIGGESGRVERKLEETNTLLRDVASVLRDRDGVTVNVAGSPVGDPQETGQAVKLALRTR